jgi:hypothetical protein
MSKKDQILKLLKSGKDIAEVAKVVKVRPGYVYYIRWMDQNKSDTKAVRKTRKKASRLMQEVARTHKAVDAAVQREKELAPMRARDTGLTEENRKALEFLQNNLAHDTDPVNHPPHYRAGGIETIDFIEAKDLNYRLGNVIKYVSRAGKKSTDPVQDLEKAAWYLNREIEARRNA